MFACFLFCEKEVTQMSYNSAAFIHVLSFLIEMGVVCVFIN